PGRPDQVGVARLTEASSDQGERAMEIFADTSDVNEIAKWLRRGVLDGVTTNPSIMVKDGARDIEKAAREIAEIVQGRPVPAELIATAARWVERWNYGKILVGSVRGNLDVQRAAAAGAHIVTIPPAVLDKLLEHKYTRETVRGFNADARKALTDMDKC